MKLKIVDISAELIETFLQTGKEVGPVRITTGIPQGAKLVAMRTDPDPYGRLGREVYDFRGAGDGWGNGGEGAGGFGWKEVDPEWQNWPNDIPRYIAGLNHPRAIEGFKRDMDALRRADACILVNPCGQSAHMELGWAVGAGKLTAAFCPGIREPDLMLKMAGHITNSWDSIELWLRLPLEL